MSLRHPFPNFEIGHHGRSVEPEFPPSLSRKPREVEFRPSADKVKVCQDILGYNRVRLDAAVGAGKSTDIPTLLADVSKLLVVHVVPSRLLAVSLYDYLVERHGQDKFSLMLETTDPMPQKGVLITYSAVVVAMYMLYPKESMVLPFSKCIMYLDEAHESDAFTNVLHQLGTELRGAATVVLASATHEPDRSKMREEKGKLEAIQFPTDEKPSAWNPLDVGKPWSITSTEGNMLLFVDVKEDAEALVARYNRAGATAFRLHSKMPVRAFRDAMKKLWDPKSGIIVLVADYSFRSGFTFDVSTIIDSGVVTYVEVMDGQMRRAQRWFYDLEFRQAQGRGARIAGSSCKYYYPNAVRKSAICDLEGVEIDAAAILFRWMGYAPPGMIGTTARMAKGNIPIDIVRSFNDDIPLLCLPAASLEPFVRVPPKSRASVVSVSGLVEEYMKPSPTTPSQDFFSAMSLATEDPRDFYTETGLGFLQELMQVDVDAPPIEVGQYYNCPGVPVEKVVTRLYHTDWQGAVRELTKNPELALGFTVRDRTEIVAMLLEHYNRCNMLVRGIDRMFKERDTLAKLVTIYPDQVRCWTEQVTKKLRECDSNRNALANVLGTLKTEDVLYQPLAPHEDHENKIAMSYARKLSCAIEHVRSTSDSGAYMNMISDSVGDPDFHIKSDAQDWQFEHKGLPQVIDVTSRPVRIGGHQKRSLSVTVPPGIEWTHNDCVDMLTNYLDNTGLSAGCIARLRVEGADKVVPSRVLGMLHDDDRYRHRSKTKFKMKVLGNKPHNEDD